MRVEIQFSGHENIRSNHKRTIEITKESHLTPRGDCIVGVNANSSCVDLPPLLKEKIRDTKIQIRITLLVGDHQFTIYGNGHPDLTLTHTEDIVIRMSDFLCPRTLAINCDKASDQIPREMIQLLQNPETRGIFRIDVD